MKKGILVVSCGPTYAQTRQKTSQVLEQEIEVLYPEWIVKRAFTSGMIIDILKERGMVVPSVKEALLEMVACGVEELVVQPTLLLAGDEYDKMCAFVAAFQDQFKSIRIGEPLMYHVEDLGRLAHFYGTHFERSDDEMLLLMGHGTEHVINPIYTQLQDTMHQKGFTNILIGTVEATPTLDDILAKLGSSGYKKVVLAPLMLVAGDHAINDMGGDEEDSWKTILEKEGYETRVEIKGMGEYSAIRQIYKDHLDKVM